MAMNYIKSRLRERSTWALFTTGIASAAMLPEPWAYWMLAVHVIMALLPDGDVVA
jgi:hypothetical protein